MAKATTYLGSVESDRGNYPEAIALLKEGLRLARVAVDPRREAFALSMLGRVSLTLGDPDTAHTHLDEAISLAERDHWLFFLPWPQSLKGEAHLALHNVDEAAETLRQSFARACQFEDPCWEAMSTRGLGLIAEAQGDTELAFRTLEDARGRSTTLQPTRRPLYLAQRAHPGRPVRPRTTARTSPDTELGGTDAGHLSTLGDERTHGPGDASCCRSRRRRGCSGDQVDRR